MQLEERTKRKHVFLFLKKIKLQWIQFFLLEIRIFFWIAQKCIWILVEKKCMFLTVFLCHRTKNLLFLFQTEQNIFPFLCSFLSFYPTNNNNNNKFYICIKWLYLNYIKHLFLLLCLFKIKIAHNWSFTKKEKPNEESFFLFFIADEKGFITFFRILILSWIQEDIWIKIS